jgi:hypothetical protein
MRDARPYGVIALVAVASALIVLGSCASGPTKAAPEAAKAVSSAPQAAPKAKGADAAKPASAAVEISFPYRRAPRPPFIVASLHEPLPPTPKVAEVKTEAPIAAAAPPTSQPTPAAAPVAPKAAASPAAPKAAALPAAKDKSATPKAAPKATGKKDQKAVEAEPKNAASTASLAVVADPGAERKAASVARRVSAVEGTRFELPFDGTGWTYLGEQTNKEGIAYDSRRFEDTSLVFILNPVKAGEYALRFQRQDSLRGLSYEELVGVTVAPKPASMSSAALLSSGASTAPASPAAAPARPAVVSAGAAATPLGSSSSAAPAAALPAQPLVDPASLATPEAALAAARSELGANRVQSALVALDRLYALSPEGTDEAAILYARALEKSGPQKDIKRAYSYYKKLRDDYPESAFWDEAAARCSYIERHYFDIR